jgi:hypothetical protein
MSWGNLYDRTKAFFGFSPLITLRQDGAKQRSKINVARVSLNGFTAQGLCLGSSTTFE